MKISTLRHIVKIRRAHDAIVVWLQVDVPLTVCAYRFAGALALGYALVVALCLL